MTCIYALHRSLAPMRSKPTPPFRTGRRPAFLWDQDPTYTKSCPPVPPVGWPDWLHARAPGTTAPSSQMHRPPQSTPKQHPPKQRQSHRAHGTTAPSLQMHCPSSPPKPRASPKPHASPKPQASPKQRRLPQVVSLPFPVTGLLHRTSLQTDRHDSNHCRGQCPS